MMGWHGGNKFGLAEGRLKCFSGDGQIELALQGDCPQQNDLNTTVPVPCKIIVFGPLLLHPRVQLDGQAL